MRGIAFHCHHDKLCEYVYDYDKRVEAIKRTKPVEEQELRLRLFKMIPDDRLPGRDSPEYLACDKAGAAFDKAGAAYDKAGAAYDKAGAAYDKAWAAYDKAGAAYDKAGAAYDKAWAAYNKAVAAYDKAVAAYDKAWAAYNKEELERLHIELCPNCPWDGHTIFSKSEKETGK